MIKRPGSTWFDYVQAVGRGLTYPMSRYQYLRQDMRFWIGIILWSAVEFVFHVLYWITSLALLDRLHEFLNHILILGIGAAVIGGMGFGVAGQLTALKRPWAIEFLEGNPLLQPGLACGLIGGFMVIVIYTTIFGGDFTHPGSVWREGSTFLGCWIGGGFGYLWAWAGSVKVAVTVSGQGPENRNQPLPVQHLEWSEVEPLTIEQLDAADAARYRTITINFPQGEGELGDVEAIIEGIRRFRHSKPFSVRLINLVAPNERIARELQRTLKLTRNS